MGQWPLQRGKWDNGAGSGAQPRVTACFGNGVALSHLTGPAFFFPDLAINRILAQLGIGGSRPCFAWRVLDSGSAWHGWSLAMLSLGGAGAVLRSLRPPATSRASYVSVRRPRSCW